MSKFADISETYQGVRTALSSALKDLDGVTVRDDEGNKHLGDVRKTLSEMEASFNQEIAHLEKHADWQNFTVAFFGETNAGKSTIIESLRIIMEEQTRSERLRANAGNVATSEASFAREAEGLIRDLQAGYEDYGVRIADLGAQIHDLAASSRRAAEAAQHEVEQARKEALLIAKELADVNNEMARATRDTAESAKRAAKRLWLGLGAGIVCGAVVGAAVALMFH